MPSTWPIHRPSVRLDQLATGQSPQWEWASGRRRRHSSGIRRAGSAERQARHNPHAPLANRWSPRSRCTWCSGRCKGNVGGAPRRDPQARKTHSTVSKKTHASNFFRCETLTPSTLDGKTEPGDRHALAHASGFADDCRCMVAPGGGDGSVGTGAEVRMGEEPMTASSALGALFLLAIGGEVLAVAYHRFRSGELPAGAKGTARVSPTPRRQSARVQFFPGTVFQRWHGVGSVGLAHPGGHGPTAEVAVIATTTAAVARPERDLASAPSSPDHTGSSRVRCSFADGRTSTAPRLGECDHV